jgi:tetratricopeptide (TPR) repeat protein
VESLHGRSDAVARARVRVERACSGEGGLILLTGEAGIGKSRLAERVAEIAGAAGSAVVWGRCWEAGGAPPYWPWIQVFRALGMQDDPFVNGGGDQDGSAAQARFGAFDRAVTQLKACASQTPLTIILDDLHAADVPSLLLLLLLARELRRAPILVVGAYRDAAADLAPEVASLLGKIAREGDVLPLSRLGADHVAAWIGEVVPGADTAQAAAVYRLTEGHPLFVAEVLRVGLDSLSRRRLLDGLRIVLDEHLARLPAATRAVLEVGAVLGRGFEAADLATAAALPVDEVDVHLRAARAAGVITATAPGANDPRAEQLQFSHVLLRDRLYEELPPSRRASLHWAAGLALLAHDAEATSAVNHLLAGQTAGDPVRAAEVTLTAANAALARFAFEDAVHLCQRACDLPALSTPSRLVCELRLTLAQALMRAGDAAAGKKACTRAADLARQIDAGDLLGQAALIYGSTLFAGFGDQPLVASLREALARVGPGDSAIRAKVMARLAAALNPPHAAVVPEILALARDATAMARRLADPATLLQVLQSVVSALVYLADEDERFALQAEIVSLGRALDQRVAVVDSTGWYIGALLGRGQATLAAQEMQAYARLLAEFPQPHFQWRLPLSQALFHAFSGDFVSADRASDEAHALATRRGSAPGLRAWGVQRVAFAQMRGDPAVIAKDAAEILRLFESIQVHIPSSAWIHAAMGDQDEAARRLRHADIATGYFPALIIAADAAVMLGDREIAQTLYAPLLANLPAHQLFLGPAGASAFGPTARVLGEMALLLGRPAEAIAHYDQAIALCERIGAVPFVELTRGARAIAAEQIAAASDATPAHIATTTLSPPLGGVQLDVRREGDVWAIASSTGPGFRLKHSKGLAYLRTLIDHPGREVHVLELVGIDHAVGDAGPVLDPRAKAAYRARLDDLKDELDEAERFGDAGRRERAQAEFEAIADQLAGAVGLGGRDRVGASDVERARINVQRRFKDTLDRIAQHDASLARYLSGALQTGIYCSFTPR